SPWGQKVPIHIAWFLMWVAAIAGLLFLIVHATWLRFFAKKKEFDGARSTAFAGRADVSLDHGRVDVHTSLYRLPSEVGSAISLGHLSLDRWCGVDGFHCFSHLPCLVLARFLVHLA